MDYRLNKIWLVMSITQDDTQIHVFKNRYQAYNLFLELKKLIDEKYPEETTFEHNINSSKGDVLYGTLEPNITIRLIGKEINHYYNNDMIKEIKEELYVI